jgi:lipopolysaccharide transport system ATP-binding protein
MSEIAIRVENLSKLYKIGAVNERHDTLRDQIADGFKTLFQRNGRLSSARHGEDTFWALKKISFEVKKGDIVGIIGRNGAGKSTLLKILSRITKPTEGQAEIYGRVGSLLEVGTGFHPELTGRENIYLNGAILGMKKAEIERKFDEIVAFSEIEKFIDTPAKRYSSGMYVRLAFAVAAHLEPEILIVDEVLAVGDAGFQKKCLGKIHGVANEGRTVLFVSHNMAAVERLCNKVNVLHNGNLVFSGATGEATSYYFHNLFGNGRDSESYVYDLRNAPGRPSGCRPLLERVEFYTSTGEPLKGSLQIGDPLIVHVHFGLEQPTSSFSVGLGFDNMYGQRVFTANSGFQAEQPKKKHVGRQVFVCEIPSLTLVPGEYMIKVGLAINDATADIVEDAARLTISEADYYGGGKDGWRGFFVLKHHWYMKEDCSHDRRIKPRSVL